MIEHLIPKLKSAPTKSYLGVNQIKRIYKMSFTEMAEKWGGSPSAYYYLHKRGKLKEFLTHPHHHLYGEHYVPPLKAGRRKKPRNEKVYQIQQLLKRIEKLKKKMKSRRRIIKRGRPRIKDRKKSRSFVYSPQFRTQRKIVIRVYNKVCQLCGRNANTVHHRDLNKNNNSLDNLLLLCNSCHTWMHKSGWEL